MFYIPNCMDVRRLETFKGRRRRGAWEDLSTRLSERSDRLDRVPGEHRTQGDLTNSKPSERITVVPF